MCVSDANSLGVIRTLVLVSIFPVGLATITAIPAFAGSSSFNTSGSMHVAGVDHLATLLTDFEVVVAGGVRNTTGYISSAELYNPLTGSWRATGGIGTGRYDLSLRGFPTERCWLVAAPIAGGGGVSSAELCNPASGTTASMTLGNETIWAVLLQNGELLNDNKYNPLLGTWIVTSHNPVFAHPPVVLLPNANAYAGSTIQGGSICSPFSNQWANFPPTPCTPIHQSCEGAGALRHTGSVLVAGDPTLVNAPPYPIEETTGLVLLFNPSRLTWASAGA